MWLFLVFDWNVIRIKPNRIGLIEGPSIKAFQSVWAIILIVNGLCGCVERSSHHSCSAYARTFFVIRSEEPLLVSRGNGSTWLPLELVCEGKCWWAADETARLLWSEALSLTFDTPPSRITYVKFQVFSFILNRANPPKNRRSCITVTKLSAWCEV